MSEENRLATGGERGWPGRMSNSRIFRDFKTSPEIIRSFVTKRRDRKVALNRRSAQRNS
jgi:hypothetical protein